MRVVVMSDSHGSSYALRKIFDRHRDAALYIHLGDGERELDLIAMEHPDYNIRHVAGNCDYSSLSPDTDIEMVGGRKLLFTHGHHFHVNYSNDDIIATARRNCADVVLFGHTHKRLNLYDDGLYVVNPGSCALPRDCSVPSYAIVDIEPSGISVNIVDL